MNFLLKHRELALSLIIALMVMGISVYAPAFASFENATSVLNDTSILCMLALGQMMVIITRGIDLSVASNLALSGMLSASLAQNYPDLPVITFIAVAVTTGLVLGMINGGLVAMLGIPPIVVTLGTLAVFRGMIVVYGGGNQVNASEMGDVFQSFPKLTLFGLSTIFWIMAAVAVAAWHVPVDDAGGPRALCGWRQSGCRALLRHRSGAAANAGLFALRGNFRALRLFLGFALWRGLFGNCFGF